MKNKAGNAQITFEEVVMVPGVSHVGHDFLMPRHYNDEQKEKFLSPRSPIDGLGTKISTRSFYNDLVLRSVMAFGQTVQKECGTIAGWQHI